MSCKKLQRIFVLLIKYQNSNASFQRRRGGQKYSLWVSMGKGAVLLNFSGYTVWENGTPVHRLCLFLSQLHTVLIHVYTTC